MAGTVCLIFVNIQFPGSPLLTNIEKGVNLQPTPMGQIQTTLTEICVQKQSNKKQIHTRMRPTDTHTSPTIHNIRTGVSMGEV